MSPSSRQPRTTTLLRWMPVAALLLASLAAVSIQAAEPTATASDDELQTATNAQDEATAADATSPAPTLEALRVYRDPETGALVKAPEIPGKALSPGLQRRVSRSTEGLAAKTLRDGTETLDLQGRFLVLSVAKRQADGTFATSCVHSAEAAAAAMTAEPDTAQPTEEASDVR